MDIHVYDFDDLAKQEWDSPLEIKAADADVSGGKIDIEEIDRVADHPEAKSVCIFGLRQDTFEYFIRTYGRQFRYIRFFKNKSVEDWSLLGTLPELEGLYWFHNQKITKLWDMSKNYALKAVELSDFTKLHDLSGIEKAPALEWFGFGDAVWSTSEIESLRPFLNTGIRRISFSGKTIRDMDISFIPQMKSLEVFDFPTNLFTMEEVAELVGKRPDLEGYSLKPYIETKLFNEETRKADKPGVVLVGKRKPVLAVEGNEKRIASHVSKFNKIVEENTPE